MVTITIDKKTVQVPKGTIILEAAKQNGIPIPTLCYLKDINEIGASVSVWQSWKGRIG